MYGQLNHSDGSKYRSFASQIENVGSVTLRATGCPSHIKAKSYCNVVSRSCGRLLFCGHDDHTCIRQLQVHFSMYGAFTMDAIASSAFSTKLDSLNDPESHFVKAAKNAFSTDYSWRVAAFQLFPNLMKFLKITIFPPEPLEFFKTVTLRIIDERRRTGQTRNDFLQLLIDTSKETMQDQKLEEAKNDEQIMSNYNIDDNTYLPVRNAAHKNLSEIEMVGQCVIFFIAGYDTTANTLACASYFLALNPEIQEKLFAELKEVVNKTKGEFTYEAMQEMKYFDNVIAETLRLYPVTPRLERVADVDLKLKETGITIPRDMIVTIPIYPLQRDPEIYPNPDVFDPDRIRAHYKQLSEFERGRIIGLKEAGWENRKIARHIG
ncbi:cytochrome P450 3A9 [Trichonephila clavipes]|nr:cytochrome P450 3A9 [Trichonephila clavipes]